MLWLFLALAAAFVISVANVLDKHAITDEIRDPYLASTIAGFTLFVVLGLFSLVSNPLALSPVLIPLAFLAGVTYNLGLMFYYKASQDEEVSRVIPMMKAEPVLVLVISFLFLGEVLTILQYLGAFAVIGGAVLISVKRSIKQCSRRAIGLALVAAFFLAVRNVFVDIAATDLFAMLAWVGLGGFIVGAVLFAAHHPHLKKKAKKGVRHLLFTNALAVIFFLLYTQAIALRSVSLVATVVASQVFFVFVIATVLSRTHSFIVREELRESTLLVKGLAILLVFGGLALLV